MISTKELDGQTDRLKKLCDAKRAASERLTDAEKAIDKADVDLHEFSIDAAKKWWAPK